MGHFEIPRGRVMLHVENERGVVLHGNATDTTRLNVIAEAFQLTNWIAEQDVHYLIGKAADEIFLRLMLRPHTCYSSGQYFIVPFA